VLRPARRPLDAAAIFDVFRSVGLPVMFAGLGLRLETLQESQITGCRPGSVHVGRTGSAGTASMKRSGLAERSGKRGWLRPGRTIGTWLDHAVRRRSLVDERCHPSRRPTAGGKTEVSMRSRVSVCVMSSSCTDHETANFPTQLERTSG